MSATPEPATLAHAQLTEAAAVTLTDRVMYRISGPGTDQFLQGQLSQNLADVTAGHAPRAAASTPKGRAYLLTRVVRDHDDILISMPASIAEEVSARLNKYLMLFRGTVMAKPEHARLTGILGEAAARNLAPAGLPAAVNDVIDVPGGYLVRTSPASGNIQRFELWLPDGVAPELQAALAALPECSLADWKLSEVAAGIAELAPETLEAWVPQMLNWQHLEGIHFKKGCYTGQEIIARMHYLGQLKKSLFRFSATGSIAPSPGSEILAGDKAAGEVVQAVAVDDGTLQLLAVLRHSAASGPLRLAADGPALKGEPLPYDVPERQSAEAIDSDT